MIPNPHPGKLIVVDSLDGSGQSTQINLIGQFFSEKNIRYWLTKEPTKFTKWGLKINRVLDKLDEAPDPKTFQEWFTEDRKLHQKEIIPHLKKASFVISDRYFPATYAYGGASGIDTAYLEKINSGFIEPNLTIILKVFPKTASARIVKRGEKHKLFEKEEMLARVWPFYEKYAKTHKNVHIINGEIPPEEIFENIRKILES